LKHGGEHEMGIDVRFYYASLVAIFLFFLLGLLIGVGLSRQPAVERLAAHIEKQLRQYREEVNKQLQARDKLIRSLQDEIVSAQQKIKWQEQFLHTISPLFLKGLLRYRNVAIFVTAPENDEALLSELKRTLSSADADVRSVTRFRMTAWTSSSDTLSKLAEAFSIKPQADPNGLQTAYQKALLKKLASLVRFGDIDNQLKRFVHAGLVKLSGDYSHPIGGAVIISAIKGKRLKDEFEAIDLELANSLKMLGAKVVVCETSNAEESVVPMCQHIGVTTVDNAESAIGQICIAYALAGYQGNYGWKESARIRFPEMDIGGGR
jgi:hypothetical protein